jgi:hypothetical protein
MDHGVSLQVVLVSTLRNRLTGLQLSQLSIPHTPMRTKKVFGLIEHIQKKQPLSKLSSSMQRLRKPRSHQFAMLLSNS